MKRMSLLLLLVVLACNSIFSQNKALSLDGSGDFIEVVDSDNLDVVHITTEAWVLRKSEWRSAVVIAKGHNTGYLLSQSPDSSAFRWHIQSDKSWEYFDSNQYPQLSGEWIHLASTLMGNL
ncbi:TPA: hypothetical protein EYN65_10725 [Candidatus Poribacteria bacterium]|jgi:hypothetical protein|nr:hypothetical protein [Candidatus Poribacteria bacterium]HIB86060.1 hypothetical protein [Candidatus Poribacteria bacterium]HIC17139.1 hypothetical protein [Candidatus Poribacteria bacterium]HIM10227.1 hypothetical protein [Candidatus Poribacteria bacterium]HIO05967.1 hypothetical protein [Candidatus Poribacteria bacterium]